jgi:hypothetical protein
MTRRIWLLALLTFLLCLSVWMEPRPVSRPSHVIAPERVGQVG